MAQDLANAILTKAKEINENENPPTYIMLVFNGTQPIFYDIIKTPRQTIIKRENIVYKFDNDNLDPLLTQFWTFVFKDHVNVISRNSDVRFLSYAIGWHRKEDKKLLLCDADSKVSCDRLAQFATLVCSPYVTIE